MSFTRASFIRILFYICIFKLCLHVNAADNDSDHDSVKLVLKVKQGGVKGVNHLFRQLHFFNLTLYDELTPFTYILDYNGSRRDAALRRTITKIKRQYDKKILELEPTREYNDTIKPVDIKSIFYQSDIPYLRDTNLVCENYYGMGIKEAWSRGYTGKGVTIAITDVGINIELLDLKKNLNTNLSFNFVDNNHNVIPEYFYNIRDKASYFTDHGNKMASVIGATKGNNLCSAGIAYDANITALKIFRVIKSKSDFLGLQPRHWTRSDVFSRALKYNLHVIDVFANAWAPVKAFDKLDIATNDAISYGASIGRRGLGTIHVVPSGPPGSQLSNNIDTITVSSIGRYGRLQRYTFTDASVLTSGLGDGNNLTSNSMVTTTLNNRCVTGFNGVSACTAQVAAIIGLGLQANAKLSYRDVQHLLVHSSEHTQLKETIAFQKNAAGRHFHGVIGFGLLHADKFVQNALKHRKVKKQREKLLDLYITRTKQRRTQTFEFCYQCKTSHKGNCLTVLEHVVVQMDLKASSSADIKIAIISPGKTTSVLMEFKPKQDELIDVKKLRLVSVHFWDEMAFGKWQLLVQDEHSANNIRVKNLSLKLYGTSAITTPKAHQQYSNVCTSNERSNTKTTDSTLLTAKSPNPKNEIYDENNHDTPDSPLPLFAFALSMVIMFLLLTYFILKRYSCLKNYRCKKSLIQCFSISDTDSESLILT